MDLATATTLEHNVIKTGREVVNLDGEAVLVDWFHRDGRLVASVYAPNVATRDERVLGIQMTRYGRPAGAVGLKVRGQLWLGVGDREVSRRAIEATGVKVSSWYRWQAFVAKAA